jgi:hypothetical protein
MAAVAAVVAPVAAVRAPAASALAPGEYAPPPFERGPEPIDSDGDPDPAGLQTGAIARCEQESHRLFFNAAPEVAQLFRVVLASREVRMT